jgi:hypothetical protein
MVEGGGGCHGTGEGAGGRSCRDCVRRGACGIRRVMDDACCCCCCCTGGGRNRAIRRQIREGDEGGWATDSEDGIFFCTGGLVSATARFKGGGGMGAREPPKGRRAPTTPPAKPRASAREVRLMREPNIGVPQLLARSTISISPASACPVPTVPPARGTSKNAEPLSAGARAAERRAQRQG